MNASFAECSELLVMSGETGTAEETKVSPWHTHRLFIVLHITEGISLWLQPVLQIQVVDEDDDSGEETQENGECLINFDPKRNFQWVPQIDH